MAEKGGDPVRITNGVYEQEEADILISGIQNYEVKRIYTSDNTIISSFGYGWATNLDERIFLGIDPNKDNTKKILEDSVEKYKDLCSNYEQTLCSKIGVSNFKNAKSELEGKINTLNETVTEDDVKEITREVKLALLEADVNYKVVKEFINKVKEKALGEEVQKSLKPGEVFVKIVKDELVELLGKTKVFELLE